MNIIVEKDTDSVSMSVREPANQPPKMKITMDQESVASYEAQQPRNARPVPARRPVPKAPARARAPPPPQPQRQFVVPPPKARPYIPDVEGFKEFTNPNKRHKDLPTNPQYAEDGGMSDMMMSEEPSFDDEDPNDNNNVPTYAYDEDEQDDVIRPSLGFSSIEEEKQDIILKLHRLKQKGFPVTRTFTQTSDIYEMRTELSKIKYSIELDSSIKFSRKMLMGCVSTIEFMNKKWDPFDLALNGWSENVMESIDDYDPVFEKLYDKYKGKVSMPPELELVVAVSGSAFMYHLSHSMLRSLGPKIAEKIKKNPEILKSAMKEAAAEHKEEQANMAKKDQQQQQQRPMRGPTFEPVAAMRQPMPSMPPPIPTRDITTTTTETPRMRRQRAPSPSSSSSSNSDGPPPSENGSSRISDVPSDDLQSVSSISIRGEAIRTVEITGGPAAAAAGRGGRGGRGRGRGGGGRGRGRGGAGAGAGAGAGTGTGAGTGKGDEGGEVMRVLNI
jgi:hypothetical protein